MQFSYVGPPSTTTWTWSLQQTPGTSSNAQFVQQATIAYLSPDVDGRYVVRFVDSSSNVTDTTITCTAPSAGAPPLAAQFDPTGELLSASAYAVNNMIAWNMAQPSWRTTARTWSRKQNLLSTLDCVQINADASAGGNGSYLHTLCLAPGQTGGTFSVTAQMPTGAPNNTIRLQILDSNEVTVLAQAVFTVTQAIQTFNVSVAGLTGGGTRKLCCNVDTNQTGQECNPLVASAKFTPTGGTGIFAGDFVRYGISGAMSACNMLGGWRNGHHPLLSPQADFQLLTNAQSIAVEAMNFSADGLLYTFYGGQPLRVGTAIASQGYQIEEFSFGDAARGSPHELFVVRTGLGSGPVSYPNFGTQNATAVRAIYAKKNDAVIWPSVTGDRVLIVGDSVTGGASATYPGYQGTIARFKEIWNGPVVCEAIASQAAMHYLGPGNVAAQQKATARYFAQCNPKLIIFDHGGRNDHANGTGGNGWSAAAYQTALTAWLNQQLVMSPQAFIALVTAGNCDATKESNVNGAGSTVQNYRDAMIAAAAAVGTDRVFVIDGKGTLAHATGDLVDSQHTTSDGQQKDAENWISAIRAGGVPGSINTV